MVTVAAKTFARVMDVVQQFEKGYGISLAYDLCYDVMKCRMPWQIEQSHSANESDCVVGHLVSGLLATPTQWLVIAEHCSVAGPRVFQGCGQDWSRGWSFCSRVAYMYWGQAFLNTTTPGCSMKFHICAFAWALDVENTCNCASWHSHWHRRAIVHIESNDPARSPCTNVFCFKAMASWLHCITNCCELHQIAHISCPDVHWPSLKDRLETRDIANYVPTLPNYSSARTGWLLPLFILCFLFITFFFIDITEMCDCP